MASAIKRMFLGRKVNCVICNQYKFSQHEDTELRGNICFGCLAPLAIAEFELRQNGFTHATEWDEK